MVLMHGKQKGRARHKKFLAQPYKKKLTSIPGGRWLNFFYPFQIVIYFIPFVIILQ